MVCYLVGTGKRHNAAGWQTETKGDQVSSLLQHHGGRSPDGRKAELLAYLVKKDDRWEAYNGPYSYHPSPESTTFTDYVELDSSGNPHLWHFYRRPKGMFGCWVVFEYNGKDHAPDLSVPISLFKMPRDAKKLTDAESVAHWKR
jgi:hypothetical protein